MGNDLSAIGGALATVGTSIAAGVTFGQVKELNQAVVSTAEFTANKVSGSIIGNGVAAAASAIATAGTGIAVGVTLGQVDALNKATEHLAKGTVHHVLTAHGESAKAVIGLVDGTPVVGHIKGAIHYAVGDTEGGDQIMRSASRTIGVIGGGVAGIAGGPAGMVAGGIAGGAAADGIITGIESGIHGEFRPSGQIGTVNQLATHTGDDQALVESIVQGLVTTSMDGLTGLAAGTKVEAKLPAQMKVKLKDMRTKVKAKLSGMKTKVKAKVTKTKAKVKGKRICKRSVDDNDDDYSYNTNLPDIPNTLAPLLPGSTKDLNFAETADSVSLMDSALSLVFILKLMSVGHIKAKPYFGEICSRNYPNFDLEDCTSTLHLALAKYGTDDELEKAMEHLSRNVVIDHMIEAEACKGMGDAYPCKSADQRFNSGLLDINSFMRSLGTKTRVKRSGRACPTGKPSMSLHETYKFQEREAWGVINKHLDDVVDSHMKLEKVMADSGKWTETMNRMSEAEIDSVVKNLRDSAENAREASRRRGFSDNAPTTHSHRPTTYDIAVSSLEQFKAQRSMGPSVAYPAYPPAPKNPWGSPGGSASVPKGTSENDSPHNWQ